MNALAATLLILEAASALGLATYASLEVIALRRLFEKLSKIQQEINKESLAAYKALFAHVEGISHEHALNEINTVKADLHNFKQYVKTTKDN